MMLRQNILLFLCFVSICFVSACTVRGSVPDMVPMPKEYEQLGGELMLDALPVYIEEGNRQCEIAAEEIQQRISELGGSPGVIRAAGSVKDAGIYVLSTGSRAAEDLVGELGLDITAEDPGPQGYVIHVSGDRAVILGSDSIGALYGAMTFRQMMRRDSEGRVNIQRARVYDRPDYHYRGRACLVRSLAWWTEGESDGVAAYKAAFDWLMRFKFNLVTCYKWHTQMPSQIGENTKEFWREINEYAAERGIYPVLCEWTRVGNNQAASDGNEFDGWDCVYETKHGGKYSCWSRDDLNREHILSTIDLMKECGFRVLYLHPIDGGGIWDPEYWYSRACAGCRDRFPERWQASAHQYNMWAQEIESRELDVIFISPVYPYVASWLNYEQLKERYPGLPENIWLMNSSDYWRKLHENMHSMIIPGIWMTNMENVMDYRDIWSGRPIYLESYNSPASFFGTWTRRAGANYIGNHQDILYASWYASFWTDNWMNYISLAEFAWNTAAPGAGGYDVMHYDIGTDHSGPPEILEEWVPRAARAFFGDEIGDLIAPVYNTGIMHRYILGPGRIVSRYGIDDTSERMQSQVRATAEAMTGLEAAYDHIEGLCPYRRKTFLYFYRRMPIWHMTARANYTIRLSREFELEGRDAEALAVAVEGLENFNQDLAVVDRVMARIDGQSDIFGGDPLRASSQVRDREGLSLPGDIKNMLDARVADFKVQIKPRDPGDSVRVGVYSGMGANTTKGFLERYSNADVELIDSLALSVLDGFDCVIIHNTLDVDDREYFENLPVYVRDGGRGVMFQHNMLGRPGRSPGRGERTPFPEIVRRAADRLEDTEVVIKERHPATGNVDPGLVMEHMYWDHIIPEVGPDGTVIVENREGNPVVVIGVAGKGKVIFDGNVTLGQRLDGATGPSAEDTFNAHIARHGVEWMTGVELIER